jgi:hypothetical protein
VGRGQRGRDPRRQRASSSSSPLRG